MLTPAAQAEEQGGQTLLADSFSAGFDTTNTWQVLGDGDFPQGDGVPTTSSEGLKVTPAGRDSTTGEPAFRVTTAQQDDGGNGSGDHGKWLAFPRATATSGMPGYDIPKTGSLSCTSKISGRTFGTERHPFGSAVADPRTDVRLASAAMVTADFDSKAIFDFSVVNGKIYAIYERLPEHGATYAAYSYAIPVADRTPGEWATLQVRLDQGGTRVTWKVNGRTVLSTDRIGTRAFDRTYMILDHGGTEERLKLKQLTCGFGLFTVLDAAAGPRGKGLVRLDSTPDFYYAPRVGSPTPQTFVDEESRPESRLWGQGAEIKVRSTQIRRES
ncbi:hypothetical protein GTY64_09460 [Streptomyces sp. SID8376]|nr:hypothetical protein [Streptomyces sp. McG7]MBT2904658.1 hypothetical protein [Streptomyces sp. McG8]MXQ59609.1 hypothetical protein [Streptomyces sp. XHT-2]MYQ31305.1 hypothetical protein [Streptomyces sp. SID4956]MYW51688.1 hypothetical protein [Streptomyces sp. SID8376]THC59556.1 hypothetical protein E7X38_02340 [Streptomyces sp. Akac8]UVT13798.1 hypothetical protein AY578_04355 [Streptomyces thermocarboxydus]